MCHVRVLTEDEENQIVLDTRYITVNRIPIKGHYNPHECCSKVQLQGRWIDKCGFEAEDKLTVWIYKGRIVVEKEDPNTIDTKLLARIQNESSRLLRKKIKEMVHPEVFEQLRFVNGEIKVK